MISCVGFRKASTQPTGDCDRTASISTSSLITPYTSIWHDGVTENSIFKPSFVSSSTQIGISEIGSPQLSESQVRSTQIGSSQIAIFEISPPQNGSSQIGSPEISPTERDLGQISPFQTSIAQISPNQELLIDVGSTQISTTQVNTIEISSVLEVNPSKISLPSSISLQQLQFFHPHLLTSAIIDTYDTHKDNPLNLFDPTFNINLQITDLPTGQLAEAQITQFDQYDRPNVGTLLIDHDANGVGWFIDPTPWENSEFAQTLADTVESHRFVGWVQRSVTQHFIQYLKR